jgi:hypothetical protein
MGTGPLIAAVKVREVVKISQGCPFSWATQYPVVKCAAVHIFPVPLIKRKLFRVDQITHLPIPFTSQWTELSYVWTGVVHTYTGGPEKWKTVKHHIHDGSSPLSVFLSYFVEIITLWWWRLIDIIRVTLTADEGRLPVPDVTETKMFVFRVVTNRWDISSGTD